MSIPNVDNLTLVILIWYSSSLLEAYEATEWIQFENKYMRHDIGKAIDEA